MELRVNGCRACAEVTSGDCGGHGPRVIPVERTLMPTIVTPSERTNYTPTLETIRAKHERGGALYAADEVAVLLDLLATRADEARREAFEAAAKMLSDEVGRHRAIQRSHEGDQRVYKTCGDEGAFCEDYGCYTLEEFAKKMREAARG